MQIDAGDYVDDAAAWPQSGIAIRGVGGRVRISSVTTTAESKAIFVIKGTAIESDGRVLNSGDFVSFKPGSFHNTRTETGCLMIVFEWA